MAQEQIREDLARQATDENLREDLPWEAPAWPQIKDLAGRGYRGVKEGLSSFRKGAKAGDTWEMDKAALSTLLSGLQTAFSPIEGLARRGSAAITQSNLLNQPHTQHAAAPLGALAYGASQALGPGVAKALKSLSKAGKVPGKAPFVSGGRDIERRAQRVPVSVERRKVEELAQDLPPRVPAVGGPGEPTGAAHMPGGLQEPDYAAYKAALDRIAEQYTMEGWKGLSESLKRRILEDPAKLMGKIEGQPGYRASAGYHPETKETVFYVTPSGETSHVSSGLHELIHRAGKVRTEKNKLIDAGKSFPLAAETEAGRNVTLSKMHTAPSAYPTRERAREEIGPLFADRLLPTTDPTWQFPRQTAWNAFKDKAFRKAYEQDLQNLWPESKAVQHKRARMKETMGRSQQE